MATKKNEAVETVKDSAEFKYSKNAFTNSNDYNPVLIAALLDDNKEYSKAEVNKMIEEFRNKFKKGGN